MFQAARAVPSRSVRDVVLLLLLGFAAGFLNGLLGAGGGVLLVFALRFLARRAGQESDFGTSRDTYANALAVMLPISVLSAFRYAGAGALDPAVFAPLLLPAVAGGILGGVLLDRLKLPVLRLLFAILVIWSGAVMILR